MALEFHKCKKCLIKNGKILYLEKKGEFKKYSNSMIKIKKVI